MSKWNLTVTLNELTEATFEPPKDTDLKHSTLETAFLLDLAPASVNAKSMHVFVFETLCSKILIN